MASPFLTGLLAWSACFLQAGDAPPVAVRPVNPLAALAGQYDWSTGFVHKRLKIAADGRFAFTESGCLGVYDRHEGHAEVVHGRLILRPKKLNLPRTGICLRSLGEVCLFGSEKVEDLRLTAAQFLTWDQPTEFIPVRWGARLFLVPRDEGPAFCDCVNRGFESVNFYYRDDAPGMKVEGLPKVPKDWEPMLLKEPLKGKVIEVISPHMARIVFGAESGAWRGMPISIGEGLHSWCKVVSVGPTTCVIERVRSPEIHFEVGQSVWSRKTAAD